MYRPGGSALNAGQVGSLRAAQFIAAHRAEQARVGFEETARQAVLEAAHLTEQILSNDSNLHSIISKARSAMSRYGAAFRNPEQIERYLEDVRKTLADYSSMVRIANVSELGNAFRLRDMLICQMAYLCAMVDYAKNNGKSRGSALYYDPKGKKPFKSLPKQFTYSLEDDENPSVQEVELQGNSCHISWRSVRPIPQEDNFFENVWRSFRENGNVN